MAYLLYMIRSIQKRKFRHGIYIAIMICVMAVPFIVSIYNSSFIEGRKQSIEDITRGAVFQVQNAQETDLAMFEQIDGLDARYEDHVIYLSLAESVNPKSEELNQEQAHELGHIIEDSGNVELQPVNLFYIDDDEDFTAIVKNLNVNKWVFVVIALIAFAFACGSHLQQFGAEIGILRSIGAKKYQIMVLFWVDFLLTAVLAGIISMALSCGIMYVLTATLLGTKAPGFAWFVLYIDFAQMQSHLIGFLIIGSACVYGCVRRFCGKDIVSLQKNQNTEEMLLPRCKLPVRRSPQSTLSSLFLRRTNKPLLICVLLTVLSLLPVVYACNQLSVVYGTNGTPQYDLHISCDDYEHSLLSDKETDSIIHMEEVAEYKTHPLVLPTDYMILDSRMNGHSEIVWNNIPLAMTSIGRAEDYDASFSETLGKYDAVVTGSFAYIPYNIGDTISIRSFAEKDTGEDDAEPFELRVAALADIPANNHMVQLFLSNELYEELTKDLPVGEIALRLKTRSMAPVVAEQLKESYPALKERIVDIYSEYSEMERLHTGKILMYAVLYALMVICLVIIIFIRVLEYLKNQYHIRTVIRSIGATWNMLHRAYARQTLVMFLAGCLGTLVLGYTISLVSLMRTGYSFRISFATVLLETAVFALAGLAFLLPIRLVFHNRYAKEGLIHE